MNCVRAQNNVVFLKNISGGSGNFIFNPPSSPTPPYIDVTDTSVYGFVNNNVLNTLVADLDLTTSPSPINAPSTMSYNVSSPQLDLDATWSGLNFSMGGDYSYTKPSSFIRWIVPTHLCLRETSSVVQSPINPVLFGSGGGGLVCQ